MALTKEQFLELRKEGLTINQIVGFEKGKKPTGTKEKSLLEKASGTVEKVLGPASKFLFGSTSKTVGTLGGGLVEDIKGVKQEDKVFKTADLPATDIAFTALELFPGGGALTSLLKKIKGGGRVAEGIEVFTKSLPDKLKGQAIEQFKSVLGATTKKFKGVSERVAPELAERRVTALSRKGLEKKAGIAVSEAGGAVGEFIEQIPKETTLKTKPIIDAIEETKKGFTVKGVVVEPEKLKVANEIQDIVKEFGDELEAENIIKLRRIWDKTINKAGKGFTPDMKDTFKLEVKKEATNAIRDELGKEFPELAKLNKEFAFWKGVKDTVSETIQKKAGKPNYLATQAQQRFGTGGFITGGIQDAVIVSEAAKNLVKLTGSTAWKSISAKKKMQLAEAIESGNTGKVAEVIKRLLLGIEGE